MGELRHVRRIVGILGAALALGVAVVGSREFDADRVRVMRQEARRTAEAAGQRAADGLSAHLAELRLKADTAASNPRLVFALQGNVDERTMRDLWRTEEWWRPWRTEFKVYALAFGGPRLDVVEGVGANDLSVGSLLRRVRERGDSAAEIVAGRTGPYAAAATLVSVPGREHPAVLVLARPVDPAALRAIADKAAGPVALALDGRVVADAGADAERSLLASAIAADPKAPLVEAPDGSWAAVRTPLGPALALWTFASGAANAHDADAVAKERKVTLWAVALLVAGVALLLAFRRSQPALAGAGQPTLRTDADAQRPPGGGTLRGAGPGLASGHSPNDGADVSDGTPERVRDPREEPARRGRATSPRDTSHSGTELAPRTPPREVTFGRYMLLDRLGEGGMAEVYTAVTFGAEGFRRKFVVKRLRPEFSRDPHMVDQFIDEANLASSMVHSNIVPVFDFGKVGDEYFIAQEYILGRDLMRLTKQSLATDGRPLPLAAALFIASETLKALEYAHTKTSETGEPLGIVHRDVSPSNVLVSARGEVKLFDFGIVKAEGRVTQTQSGVVKGNVTFMSPEQARGGQVDGRADLFSLGLVLFYMLKGSVLYQGSTTYELLVRAATGPGLVELKMLDELPGSAGPLLRRALEVRPADRFQTAREFRDAISPHMGTGGTELGSLIQHLFAEDFRAEESRFRAAGSVTPPPATDPPYTRRS